MKDPSLQVTDALVRALKLDPGVDAIVHGRVYDSVPDAQALPYVQVGKPQVLPERATCLNAATLTVIVHGWTQGPKSVESKQLGAAIIEALDFPDNIVPDLQATGFRVLYCQLDQAVYLDDVNPNRQHAAVTFSIVTEPTT